MPYTIQLAEVGHIPQIVAIVNREAQRSTATAAFIDEPVERWASSYLTHHHRLPWLVSIDSDQAQGEQVMAFAKGSHYNPREGFQWSVELSIYVKPTYQGHGVARKLYTRLFHLLSVQGFHRVYARIALPNPASQGLHEHFGLTQTGLLPDFAWKFGRWYDVAIYTGSLSSTSQRIHSAAQSNRDAHHTPSQAPSMAPHVTDSGQPPQTLSVLEGWRLLELDERQTCHESPEPSQLTTTQEHAQEWSKRDLK